MQLDASKLLPIKHPNDVERGEHVYEMTRFGIAEHHVKFNEFEVLEVLRQAARCRPVDSQRKAPISIPFARLRRLPKDPMARPKTASTESAAAPVVMVPPPPRETTTQAAGDAFGAWLELGRGLVAELGSDLSAANASAAQVAAQLDNIDAVHRRRIEQLEAELLAAKQDHARDRSVAQGRLDALRDKIETLEARRAGIASIVTPVSE